MAHLDIAKEYQKPPSPGAPYSLAVPGTEQPGRSAIYRHHHFQNGILKSLDPNVSNHTLNVLWSLLKLCQVTNAHQMFEDTGMELLQS